MVERWREAENGCIPINHSDHLGGDRRSVGADERLGQRKFQPCQLGNFGIVGIQFAQCRRECSRIGVERPAAGRGAFDMSDRGIPERRPTKPIARVGKGFFHTGINCAR